MKGFFVVKAVLLQASGLALVSVGAGLMFLPAGIITAGVAMTLFGLSLERE
jgi:hypothetical protein